LPTYVYECAKNGHQFEVDQKMSDDPITKCEVCGSKVQRLLFAPAIHFKGSGFHNTDYGTKKRPKDGAPNDGAPAKSETAAVSSDGAAKSDSTSSTTSTDTKAAPKAKTATPAARARRGVGP
jgi:putative FmdB family regulatory protein